MFAQVYPLTRLGVEECAKLLDPGCTRKLVAATSLADQFEQPYGPRAAGPAGRPRATFKASITVEDVLNSRMIAYPFRLLRSAVW